MKYNFNYLLSKIDNCKFSNAPFRHIYIDDFFSPEHFSEIISAPEIRLDSARDDTELFDNLFNNGYKIIEFPGCTNNKSEYVSWHLTGTGGSHHSACEGFGITLRNMESNSVILEEIKAFLACDQFNECIARKLGLDFSQCIADAGIQKYLDGYEISPHPDVRKKAATFMVNINPAAESEFLDHHTHYMEFKPARKYVKVFWEGNENAERCWVPWGWCDSSYQQKKNNSIVAFSPSNDTLHAVKASYNHLEIQRTQIYGNLWFKNSEVDVFPQWEDLDVLTHASNSDLAGVFKKRLLNLRNRVLSFTKEKDVVHLKDRGL